MKRETSDWLMGFSTSFGITFLAMMVVLGTVCFVSYSKAHKEAAAETEAAGFQPKQGPDTYLPTPEDRLTLLVAGIPEAGAEPETYLLLGFLPDRGKIALCVLPPTTYLEYGGQGTTLGRLWQQGGVGYAKKGLGDYLGIPIHRQAAIDPEELDALMAWSGGPLEYDLGVDLNGELRGKPLSMSRGRWQLDGQRILDLLAYSGYKGGERERSDRASLLLSQLISRTLPVFLEEETGAGFTDTALSVLDTDLSAADCLQRKAALQFLARLELPTATAVFLEGSLSRNYTVYHLTDSCKARIGEMYGDPDDPPKWNPSPPGEEEAPVPVQEPVREEKKPPLDSGWPPMQEPGELGEAFSPFYHDSGRKTPTPSENSTTTPSRNH